MKNAKSWIGIFLLAIFTTLGSIGFGSWFVKNEKTQQYSKNPDLIAKKVAYTRNGQTNTYFTSVEGALKHSTSDTIYVIPGTNPIITTDCTIPSGITLCLPFEDDLGNTHKYLIEEGVNGDGFADKDSSKLATRLTLDNATLSIKGKLVIGGVNGAKGAQSVVSGKYTEILCKDSKIELSENGVLQCYGFIKEKKTNVDSLIEFNGNSSLEAFLGVYDYDSATNLLNRKENGVFPLNKFDAPHIRPKMTFHYGTAFKGKIHTYGDTAKDLNMTPTIIGKSDAFICMSNADSVVSWKFSDKSEETTSNEFDYHKTDIKLFGKCYAGSLNISIKRLLVTYKINSKDFYLPIPFSYSIVLSSGSEFTVPTEIVGIKFMPGSKLIIEKGANAIFNSNTIFYKNCTATDGSTFSYSSKESASFVNNGNVEINSGFDGIVLIEDGGNDSAKVFTGTNFGKPTDSKEGESKSVYYWGGGRANLAIKTYDYAQTSGFYFKTLGVKGISKNKKYVSKTLLNSNDLAWYDDSDSDVSYGIEIISNLGDSTNPNVLSNLRFTKNGDDVELLPLHPNDSAAYSFEGYFYDSACASQQLEYDNSLNVYRFNPRTAEQYIDSRGYVVVYGKWKHIENGTYTIETITKKQSADKLSVENSASTIVSKPIEDSFQLENLSNHTIYYYSSINASSNSGTLTIATFDGYDITIKKQDGSLVEEIKVDSSGNSTDGKTILDFAVQDTTIIQKEYLISVMECLKIVEKQYAFSLTASDSSTLKQGKSVTISLSGINDFTGYGINLSCAWSSDDSKVRLKKDGLQVEAQNNYSEKTWGIPKEKNVTINALVTDGNLVLAKSITRSISVQNVQHKLG